MSGHGVSAAFRHRIRHGLIVAFFDLLRYMLGLTVRHKGVSLEGFTFSLKPQIAPGCVLILRAGFFHGILADVAANVILPHMGMAPQPF